MHTAKTYFPESYKSIATCMFSYLQRRVEEQERERGKNSENKNKINIRDRQSIQMQTCIDPSISGIEIRIRTSVKNNKSFGKCTYTTHRSNRGH